jgi:hypothetical protein
MLEAFGRTGSIWITFLLLPATRIAVGRTGALLLQKGEFDWGHSRQARYI